VVLHTSPEAARGGPLAIVRTGDMIELDVEARRLHLDISEAEMNARLASWKSPIEQPMGGYAKLYHDTVQGADKGADLDFLIGCRGNAVARESH
jgi:dihydroxy-acid dehydratase